MLSLVLALALAPTKLPWTLTYMCDGGWRDMTEDVCGPDPYATKEHTFDSAQEAIDWINANYVFSPLALKHWNQVLTCSATYLDADNEDIWVAHQKSVECGNAVSGRIFYGL